MSLKRKLEEYHDPDYPQYIDVKKIKNESVSNEERNEKIRAVIKKEFQKELVAKEQEINEIDERLLQAKRLLQRIRYAVVSKFYTRKNLVFSESELKEHTTAATDASTPTVAPQQPVQHAIHPSLKKLLGKSPIDYDDILKVRPARQAAQTAKTTISEKLRSKKDEKKLKPTESTTVNEEYMKVPRYIEPNKIDKPIEKLNSARGRNRSRHLLVVGNTSKYIGDEKSVNGFTHKWLAYVKTKTGSDVSVEEIVAKVRFFLHPSYKPNDVVDVDSSPFQISRRGWGEFPIRVQLYFHSNIQQKPLQIIHNLVLDKKLTGLQTMGAETVVELWLNLPPIIAETVTSNEDLKLNTNDDINSLTSSDILLNNHITPDRTVHSLHEADATTCFFRLNEESNKLKIEEKLNIPFEKELDIPLESYMAPNFIQQNDNTIITAENGKTETNISKQDNNIEEKKPLAASNNKLKIENSTDILGNLTEIVDEQKDCISKSNNKPKPETTTVIKPINVNTTIKNTPAVRIVKKQQLIKCLDSKGKVILVELVVDPKNPKNIKIIRNPTILKHTPSLATTVSNVALPTKHQTPTTNKIMTIQKNPQISLRTTISNINTTQIVTTTSAIKTLVNKTNLQTQIHSQNRQNIPDKAPMNINTNVANKQATLPTILNNKNNVFMLSTSTTNNIRQSDSIVKPNIKQTTNHVPIITMNKVLNQKTSTTSLPIKPLTNNILQSKQIIYQPKQPINNVPTTISVISPNKTVTSKQHTNLSLLSNSNSVEKFCNDKKNVIMKNGQMFFIDPNKLNIKTTKPKQESLLKPQISLLKPHINKNLTNTLNTSRLVDHHMNSSKTNVADIQRQNNVSTLKTIANNNRFMVQSMLMNNIGNKRICLAKPKKEYYKDLETLFYDKYHFGNVRVATEFLLRNIPMITKLVHSSDYSKCYPFAVDSEATYNSLLLPTQRSYEWCRAKLIHRMLKKHKDLTHLPLWTTKEIVLFARQFGYTPLCENKFAKEQTSDNSNTISNMIKAEIKGEYLTYDTLTCNTRIKGWIQTKNKVTPLIDSNEVINVDDDDDSNQVKSRNIDDLVIKTKITDVWLPIEENVQKESMWLADICQSIQLQLKPEEIVQGVFHSTSQRMMVQALHSFISDLLRRSYGSKTDTERNSVLTSERTVRPDDIRKAISNTPRFDFIANNHMGIFRKSEP